MPILNVREIGQAGIISDIAPWDLPPSALTDGMNFRVAAGKIQTVGGLRNADRGSTITQPPRRQGPTDDLLFLLHLLDHPTLAPRM